MGPSTAAMRTPMSRLPRGWVSSRNASKSAMVSNHAVGAVSAKVLTAAATTNTATAKTTTTSNTAAAESGSTTHAYVPASKTSVTMRHFLVCND